MANRILILGKPGTGKTTAAESLDPAITFIISCDKKGLPFKGWKNKYKTVLDEKGKLDIKQSNYYVTSDPFIIINLIKAIHNNRPDIKTVIVDTITSMSVDEFMSKARDKGFDKFTDMAINIYDVIQVTDNLQRDDFTVLFLAHTEDRYDADGELKTSFKVVAGKLVGEKIEVESMFNEVLYTDVVRENNDINYYFTTQNSGYNNARSSKGMFEDYRIPNDYKYVLEKFYAHQK